MEYREEALRFFREQRGLSREALAARARVSERQIRNLENPRNMVSPNVKTLLRLATALAVPIQGFVRGNIRDGRA